MSHPVLQFKDASIFQGDSLVLSHVNVEINKGDFVYLIGKTGSGKSSLLKTLYGDLQLTNGSGSIVEMDLKIMKEMGSIYHIILMVRFIFKDYIMKI